VAAPAEAEALLAALTLPADRALWGLAVYASLRLGEILALTWDSLDVQTGADTGTVTVVRSWDSKAGLAVAPKTAAGYRKVGVSRKLRPLLVAHRLASPHPAEPGELVFPGRTRRRSVSYAGVYQRADRAWKAAGLQSIRPHELRHSYASLMIAAGVREKPLSVFMGHASVAITMDRYGHLFPGAEQEGVDLLDQYLDGARPGGA
jgi:integrase